MNFTTAWSTNAVTICAQCGLPHVSRIERSRRYRVEFAAAESTAECTESNAAAIQSATAAFAALVHDRMTECVYARALDSFASGARPEAGALVT
jgi:phosphoribosylformylglycinamidine synthase